MTEWDGIPQTPNVSGYHWIDDKLWFWTATDEMMIWTWPRCRRPESMSGRNYGGPCYSPKDMKARGLAVVKVIPTDGMLEAGGNALLGVGNDFTMGGQYWAANVCWQRMVSSQ